MSEAFIPSTGIKERPRRPPVRRPANRLRRRSLQEKLTVMCGLVSALTVSLIAIFMLRFQEQAAKNTLRQRASELTASLESAAITAALADDFAVVIARMKELVSESPDLRYLVLTRADGRSFSVRDGRQWDENWLGGRWTPSAESPPEGEMVENEISGGSRVYHHTLRLHVSGQPWGWLHAGLSLEPYEASVSRLWQMTGLICGGTFLLSAFASYLLARNLTKPIRSLQQFAQRVAAGTLDSRIALKSDDEIGDLAESLNTMMDSLDHSQGKLRQSLQEQAALREKDVLLREIHHRVKNNMQMLASLMRLQARGSQDETTRKFFRESEARIRSMGLIHERLYQAENLATIHMPGYLETLTSELMRVGGGSQTLPQLRLEAEPISLGIDTALPCGLIVTELVQNALKYATAEGRPGLIIVGLRRNEDKSLTLVVKDFGPGLPADFDPGRCTSLGMRLVRLLTEQLHGSITHTDDQGLRVEINFRESIYRERL